MRTGKRSQRKNKEGKSPRNYARSRKRTDAREGRGRTLYRHPAVEWSFKDREYMIYCDRTKMYVAGRGSHAFPIESKVEIARRYGKYNRDTTNRIIEHFNGSKTFALRPIRIK